MHVHRSLRASSADLRTTDKQGVTPLLAAMAAGSRRIASLMLSNAAATLNVTTMSSATKDSAALLAASNGWWDCLETILSRLVAAPPAPDKGQKPIVPAGKARETFNACSRLLYRLPLPFDSPRGSHAL